MIGEFLRLATCVLCLATNVEWAKEKSENNSERMSYKDFREGASGFLGKVLVEKLLRSCPDMKEIFLLMRPKKDLDTDERLRRMLTNPLFDILRREQPQCFDKLILMKGDIGNENLGLSAADTDTLIEKTSVIFHVAANVKFDNTLKDAILKNMRSTRDICILGERMKNLVALVHVSSAFTQTDKYVIDEIVYPLNIDWRKIIQMAETLDENLLEVFKLKYIGTMPNHYIFTKRIAEEVINDYSGSLPCVISRPTIVMPTLNEPVKGWLDNFNGPIALSVACGKGVLRLLHVDKNTKDNYVPVDTVTKSLIVAAWKRGVRMTNTQNDCPLVYNCTSNYVANPTRSMMIKIGINSVKQVPLEGTIWATNCTLIKNTFLYRLLVIPLHLMPALLVDGLLRLSGRQPRLLNLQKKIFIGNQVLSYFTQNEWDMRNEKATSLSKEIPADDQRDFGYAVDFDYDIIKYYLNCVVGSKLYFLNESMDRLDTLKTHIHR